VDVKFPARTLLLSVQLFLLFPPPGFLCFSGHWFSGLPRWLWFADLRGSASFLLLLVVRLLEVLQRFFA
jgi:hypothetical protein